VSAQGSGWLSWHGSSVGNSVTHEAGLKFASAADEAGRKAARSDWSGVKRLTGR
jgi:hypothetical protein